ncbi:hypothetical protein [Chryseobacterium sp.]|uniref:hypothetical protein n=1 Tax=Chryseobacterium sp. TaxID=1871047 RepID=UPI000EBB2760|nr:hypothetical protein [Chryseobacterium sp.]HCA05956.1 hypothetical protein [Chryseobacterium sp.]
MRAIFFSFFVPANRFDQVNQSYPISVGSYFLIQNYVKLVIELNSYEILIGKTLSEAEHILNQPIIISPQSIEHECILTSYFWGLIRKKMFLYCGNGKVLGYRIVYMKKYTIHDF